MSKFSTNRKHVYNIVTAKWCVTANNLYIELPKITIGFIDDLNATIDRLFYDSNPFSRKSSCGRPRSTLFYKIFGMA